MSGRKKYVKAKAEVGTELRSDGAEVTESRSTSEDEEQTVTASSMMQQASGITCTKLNNTNYMSCYAARGMSVLCIYVNRLSCWFYSLSVIVS